MLLVTVTIFTLFGCSTTQSTQPAGTTEIENPAPAETEIILGLVNLRQGPSMNSMIIRVLKKGAKLTVLEEKAGWLYVELEGGMKGWVGRSTTSMSAPQDSP
jgi:uncharacterized protein YgiM (DUF1202 family)